MDEPLITSFISDNSLLGASLAAGSAFLYKIFRILKTDRNADAMTKDEKSFRSDILAEAKQYRIDNERLIKEQIICERKISELWARFIGLEHMIEEGMKMCDTVPRCSLYRMIHSHLNRTHDNPDRRSGFDRRYKSINYSEDGREIHS